MARVTASETLDVVWGVPLLEPGDRKLLPRNDLYAPQSKTPH